MGSKLSREYALAFAAGMVGFLGLRRESALFFGKACAILARREQRYIQPLSRFFAANLAVPCTWREFTLARLVVAGALMGLGVWLHVRNGHNIYTITTNKSFAPHTHDKHHKHGAGPEDRPANPDA